MKNDQFVWARVAAVTSVMRFDWWRRPRARYTAHNDRIDIVRGRIAAAVNSASAPRDEVHAGVALALRAVVTASAWTHSFHLRPSFMTVLSVSSVSTTASRLRSAAAVDRTLVQHVQPCAHQRFPTRGGKDGSIHGRGAWQEKNYTT